MRHLRPSTTSPLSPILKCESFGMTRTRALGRSNFPKGPVGETEGQRSDRQLRSRLFPLFQEHKTRHKQGSYDYCTLETTPQDGLDTRRKAHLTFGLWKRSLVSLRHDHPSIDGKHQRRRSIRRSIEAPLKRYQRH